MSDRNLDARPLEAVSDSSGHYPSRVRALLGMPRPDLVDGPLELPPTLNALPFGFPVQVPDLGRTAVYGEQPSDASLELGGKAPGRTETAALTEEEDTAAARPRAHASVVPDYTQVDADTPAQPERKARSLPSGEPWQFGPAASKVSPGSQNEPPRLQGRWDRSSMSLDEEHAPPRQVPEESAHAPDTDTPVPTDHVHVAIPGGPADRKNRALEFQAAEPVAFPVDAGKGAAVVNVESPMHPPASGSRAVRSNSEDVAVRGFDGDPGPASTQDWVADAGLSHAIAESLAGVSPEHELLSASREPVEQTPAGDSIGRAPGPGRPAHADAGFEQVADREVDAAVPAADGVRANPAPVPVSKARTRTVEEVVHVPIREHRELARLEKKVERLEVQMDRERADLRQTARAQSGAAPRVVFIAGRPAAPPAEPRAYWARKHLGRITLWPGR